MYLNVEHIRERDDKNKIYFLQENIKYEWNDLKYDYFNLNNKGK